MSSGIPLEQSNSVERISKKTGIALIVLFCLTIFVFRGYTAHYNPITWDEPVYLRASQAYVTWGQEAFYSFLSGNFSAPFSRAQIDKYWERHHLVCSFSGIWRSGFASRRFSAGIHLFVRHGFVVDQSAFWMGSSGCIGCGPAC